MEDRFSSRSVPTNQSGASAGRCGPVILISTHLGYSILSFIPKEVYKRLPAYLRTQQENITMSYNTRSNRQLSSLESRSSNTSIHSPTTGSMRDIVRGGSLWLLPQTSGDVICSYWEVTALDPSGEEAATLRKIASKTDLLFRGQETGLIGGGATIGVSHSDLSTCIPVSEDEARGTQVGSLHGQFAYVSSSAFPGIEGRPSWLLGQFDILEYLTDNGEGRVLFKDVSTGDEHELSMSLVTPLNVVTVERAVGAYGLFDSSIVSLNSAVRLRDVSHAMLIMLNEGERVTRTVIGSYFPSRTSESAIRRTLDGIKLSEDWFETDEFGSAVKLSRGDVLREFHSLHSPDDSGESLNAPLQLVTDTGHPDETRNDPQRPINHPRDARVAADPLDDFLATMANESTQGPPQGSAIYYGKRDKREFAPGVRAEAMASRILADRHRGKTPHALVMEQGRTCHFQPYPARLINLFQGGVGSRFMSIKHLRYLRVDEMIDEPELTNGLDYTSGAKLPLLSEGTDKKSVKLSLRGLRTFASSHWKREIIDYCVSLEEYFERVFEANERTVSDWGLVMKVFDSLIQDTFTQIMCAEPPITPLALYQWSSTQLTYSNETVRGVWERLMSRAPSGRKRETSSFDHASQSSTAVRDLLGKLPKVQGKNICVRYILGRCEGNTEGETCPQASDRIHSKVGLPSETMRDIRSVYQHNKKQK
jgi:hypothetical protein